MKRLLIPALLFWIPLLPAEEQDADIQRAVDKLWQEYTEQGMMNQLLFDLETESRQGYTVSREQELTSTLLTRWETIMQQRRWCDANIHWDGDSVYGSKSYRTKDLPQGLMQQLHAYRTKAGELTEEEQNQFMALFTQKEAYIDAAPDAGKIDRIIQHIYREEYPQAISQLARLRQEHPDYCPQAFAELSAALTTPNRLKLLLLCTRLPLGVIRETHIMK
jgi:hypothetical protein